MATKLMYKKTLLSSTGVFVVLISIILVNAVCSNINVRWDITEEKLYSLSGGTKKILSNLTYPVTIKFYFSRSNTEWPTEYKLFAKRAWEFLLEYEHAGNGNIIIEYHDPKPDSGDEDWARRFGLSEMQTESGSHVFCGLVFLQADLEERIEWLDPAQEGTLEYDFSRIIHQLQSADKKIIGVVSFLPVFGQENVRSADALISGRGPTSQSARGRIWSFITELNKIYQVRKVAVSEDTIDPIIDLLIVIHPKDMHPDLRFAIDQYVLSGGKVLIFVDPSNMSDGGSKARSYIAGSERSTKDLFAAWGIDVDFNKVLGDLDQASRSMSGTGEGDAFEIVVRGEAFNKTNLITASLETMRFPKAGAIIRLKDSELDFEPLIQSGLNATLVPTSQAVGDLATFRTQFSPTKERFNLAVRLRGQFKTAFPEGPPASPAGATKPADPLTSSIKPSTIIVVSDADILADETYMKSSGFGYQPPTVINDNLNFLVNACEVLTGSDDLILLRTRGKFERPFTRVIELERRAQEKWREKETELQQKIESLQQKFRKLESQKSPHQQTFGLSPKQQAEVEKMKFEHERINRELKTVRKSLRADVEMLGTVLKAVNIFLMPLLVALVGVSYGVYRQRKMKRR
jgi:gliding motility-associatede transport system auxiliary component